MLLCSVVFSATRQALIRTFCEIVVDSTEQFLAARQFNCDEKEKTNHTANAQDDPAAAPSSLQPKQWKNGKPPPDHPMWQDLWQTSEQAWARMFAQGELDNWKEESTPGRDFRKGNLRKT